MTRDDLRGIVEGISDEIIIAALKNAGCSLLNNSPKKDDLITKTDFFMLGLTGGTDSALKRKDLCTALNLPKKISSNMLLDSVNSLMSRDEFLKLFE